MNNSKHQGLKNGENLGAIKFNVNVLNININNK